MNRRIARKLAPALCAGCCLAADAAMIEENFDRNPLGRGWEIWGESSLFQWEENPGRLRVTWDSNRTNSFFYHPLPVVLGKEDDFEFSMDFKLESIEIGLRPGRPFTFQIAAGFLGLSQATNVSFLRGTGRQSPNLVEFNYFPDSGFGATVSAVVASTNAQLFPAFTFPLEMTVEDQFHLTLAYVSRERSLRTSVTRNGEEFGPVKTLKLPSDFTDFRVDAAGIHSYSDLGSNGSILARGLVDRVRITVPDPVQIRIERMAAAKEWEVSLPSRLGWKYALERSADLQRWAAVAGPTVGTGLVLRLQDPGAVEALGFYRVVAFPPESAAAN